MDEDLKFATPAHRAAALALIEDLLPDFDALTEKINAKFVDGIDPWIRTEVIGLAANQLLLNLDQVTAVIHSWEQVERKAEDGTIKAHMHTIAASGYGKVSTPGHMTFICDRMFLLAVEAAAGAKRFFEEIGVPFHEQFRREWLAAHPAPSTTQEAVEIKDPSQA